MWESYIVAVLWALVVLYVPGYFLMRGLRLSRAAALICAPIAATALCSAIPIACHKLGVFCNEVTVGIPLVAISVLVWLASLIAGKSSKGGKHRVTTLLEVPAFEPIKLKSRSLPFTPTILVAYVLIGAVVCYFVFVGNLPTPEAFYSRYDNQTHLNMVQSFLDTGIWSTLYTGTTLANAFDSQAGAAQTGSFYPAAWHDLAALICCLAGAKVTVASNALISVLCAIVFPLGMFLLFSAIFPKERSLVGFGAIAASGFSSWPWVFIIKGPCLPNLLGLSLMVAAIAVLILHVDGKLVRRKLPAFIIFGFTALFALAVAHPNTVFTAFIIVAAYLGHAMDRAIAGSELSKAKKAFARFFAMLAFIVVLVAFWFACYQLPFLQGVLSYRWGESSSLPYTLLTLFSLNLITSGVQYAMIAASFVGLIRCLREKRFWLLLPLLFFVVCYVSSKCGWDLVKYYTSSLWYQTPYRFTACITICLMPIAVLGIDAVCKWADRVATGKLHAGNALNGHLGGLIALALFLVVNYATGPAIYIGIYSGHNIYPGYSTTERKISSIYNANKEHVYSTSEVAFVDEALELIPEGSLVLNQPNDGSVFAYGVNHMNTYFRTCRSSGKNENAQVIQKHLADYATNKEAHDAVEKTGAHYLLQLDQAVPYDDGVWIPQYKKKNVDAWVGIDSVRDDTPGFKVILSEGDMRLFELDAL